MCNKRSSPVARGVLIRFTAILCTHATEPHPTPSSTFGDGLAALSSGAVPLDVIAFLLLYCWCLSRSRPARMQNQSVQRTAFQAREGGQSVLVPAECDKSDTTAALGLLVFGNMDTVDGTVRNRQTIQRGLGCTGRNVQKYFLGVLVRGCRVGSARGRGRRGGQRGVVVAGCVHGEWSLEIR